MAEFFCGKCEYIGKAKGKCPQCGNTEIRELPPGLELKDGNMSLTATLATVDSSKGETGKLVAVPASAEAQKDEKLMESEAFTESDTLVGSGGDSAGIQPSTQPEGGEQLGEATEEDGGRTAALRAAVENYPDSPVSQVSLEGKIIGPCRLEKKLGEGAMGVVYKGIHLGLQKVMALKILPPAFAEDRKRVELFIQEARSAAKLDHSNIIRVYDVGNSNQYYYIAMEFVEGADLMELIKKNGKIPLKQACEIMLKSASGLATAQDHQIVHRDIKPDNIMLARGGVVKISDFGLARQVKTGFSASDEGILGTPLYMAPECIDGRGADSRSDLYALGITFYLMLSGKRPITGRSVPEIFINQTSKTPPPLKDLVPNLPPMIDNIIRKLLEKNPDNRYQHAREMVEDLTKFIEGKKEKVEVPSDTGRDLTREKFQRKKQEKKEQEKKKFLGVASSSLVGVAVLVFLLLGQFRGSLTLAEPKVTIAPNSLSQVYQDTLRKIKAGKTGLAFAKKMWGSDSPQYKNLMEQSRKLEKEGWKRVQAVCQKYEGAKKWAQEAVYLHKILQKNSLPVYKEKIKSRQSRLLYRIKTRLSMALVYPQKDSHPFLRPFLIDLYEVTNGAFYKGYVVPRNIQNPSYPDWIGGKPPKKIWDLPLRGITYVTALEYAHSLGKRLPSKEEWLATARGPEGWLYPWGNTYRAGYCVDGTLGKSGPLSVFQLKRSAQASCGARGLAGNVAEWTSSPFYPKGKTLSVLGGAWTSSRFGVALPYSAMAMDPQDKSRFVGFRCVKDVK